MKDYYRVFAGASFTATLWLSAPSVSAQVCDECTSPAPTSSVKLSAPCTCGQSHVRCRTPNKSIGERLLDHLDKVGDRIEARLPAKPGHRGHCHESGCGCEIQSNGPSCGCEPTCEGQPSCGCEASCGCEPTCGCEAVSHDPSCGLEHGSLSHSTVYDRNSLPPIVARSYSAPNSTPTSVPSTSKPNRYTQTNQPKARLDAVEPFQKSPTIPESAVNRLQRPPRKAPSLTTPGLLGEDSGEAPIPTQEPHSLEMPNLNPANQKSGLDSLPDVLIDPFRDDVRNIRHKSSAPTLLTQRADSTATKASHQEESDVPSLAPPRLTERQRASEEEARKSNESTIARTSYVEAIPVTVVKRRVSERPSVGPQGSNVENEPQVSRKTVRPSKR